jgi:hypothetical protein
MHDVQIQEVSGTKEFLVKTKFSDTEKEKVQDKVFQILSTNLPGKKYEVLESNMVGSAVGNTLKQHAIIAVVISLIGIIIYIAWRFTFIFGVAATIATFHDVLAMMGIFYVLGREMNILFITALLTIAGYSLTDTIVVFDRIRENMMKMKTKADFGDYYYLSDGCPCYCRTPLYRRQGTFRLFAGPAHRRAHRYIFFHICSKPPYLSLEKKASLTCVISYIPEIYIGYRVFSGKQSRRIA